MRELDPKDVCEFHLGYNPEKTHYQIVVASSVELDTELLLMALDSFVDEMREKEVDMFQLGDDYVVVSN